MKFGYYRISLEELSVRSEFDIDTLLSKTLRWFDR